MSVSWTTEQQQVIDLRKRNILVAAAAGSGKTAVLVERIIHMITDEMEPVDIDRLLIVTFTNAAAAEMWSVSGRRSQKRSQSMRTMSICSVSSRCFTMPRSRQSTAFAST